MSSHLARLGWDDTWSSLLATTDLPTSAPTEVGRVSRADRVSCDVLLAVPDGLRTVSAAWGPSVLRAHRADPTSAPVTGDWVVVMGAGTLPVIERVLPRRSAVVRAQVDRSSRGQILAANADVVAVVEGMAPDPDPARLERLLALAWSSGARPVVVLTKADLVLAPEAQAADLALLAPGVQVLTTSATTGVGLEALRELLSGGATIALLGASGVGKSTLLNALVGDDDAMRTRALRADGKGRHTTVTRELRLVLGGGTVLDTPGMRTVGLAGTDSLDDVFPEVEELAAGCMFADCEHRTEPGCAVLAAVASGELPERRLASYRKLLREAQHQAARADARLRAEMTQVWKARTRDNRRRPNKKL
jgi:ribosome biogenesis GTPase